MKHSLLILLSVLALQLKVFADPIIKIKRQVVEASCGQCNFKLPGKGCSLAVRIDGKAYFVDGTGIDEHGDAHAKDGFCKAIRKAEVKGKIIGNRFQASSFKLLPAKVE